MSTRTVVTAGSIVALAVGIALILTHGAGAGEALKDAVAIFILVTVVSLQVWLRDRIFRPAARRTRHTRPSFRAYTRSSQNRRRTGALTREQSAENQNRRAVPAR